MLYYLFNFNFNFKLCWQIKMLNLNLEFFQLQRLLNLIIKMFHYLDFKLDKIIIPYQYYN